MDLHFLGRGAAFNPQEGNTSCYLKEGNRLLLLDCGESVFERLITGDILSGMQEVYIAISHLHSDHCGSLGSVVLYCFYRLQVRVKLVLPEVASYRRDVSELLRIFGVADDQYEMVSPEKVGGFSSFSSIHVVRTMHQEGMDCFSFAFETPKGGVFYSADTRTADTLLDFIRNHDHIDAIYMETTLQYPANVHLSMQTLMEALPRELWKKTHLMHFGEKAAMEAAREYGFQICTVE